MTSSSATTVQIGRLDSRGLILGLSASQSAALSGALIVAVLAEYSLGATGLLLTSPAWGLLTAVALVPVAGRPALYWLPIVSHWRLRHSLGQTRYLAQLKRVATTDLAVPGIRGHVGVLEAPSSQAALIHDARTSTYTAMLSVSGSGFILAEEATQSLRVAGWGRLLAGLCQQKDVVRLQILERSLPGGGSEVRRWWAEHALSTAPWAARVLADLVTDAQEVSDRHECFIAVAIRAPRAGVRGTSVAVVERLMESVAEAARNADLEIHGWVNRARLASVLRATYDPQGAAGSGVLESDVLAGPMAVQEEWGSIRTDSAHHTIYWVQQWPRSEVHAGFLQPLLLGRGARRALSITAEPLPPAKALKDIRRAKVERIADAAQRGRMGQVEDEATRAEAADLVRREQELVAGHGDLRFVGLLTVSAPTVDELAEACAATESAAAQAMCEIRRLVGQQGQAFAAAALPFARGVT